MSKWICGQRAVPTGFDEYMNLVLDDAEDIHSKTKSRKQLGRIMLKGDNITLLQSVSNQKWQMKWEIVGQYRWFF